MAEPEPRPAVRRGVATDLRPGPRDRRHLSGTCPDGGAEPRREDRRQARGRLHGAIHDPVLNVPLERVRLDVWSLAITALWELNRRLAQKYFFSSVPPDRAGTRMSRARKN